MGARGVSVNAMVVRIRSTQKFSPSLPSKYFSVILLSVDPWLYSEAFSLYIQSTISIFLRIALWSNLYYFIVLKPLNKKIDALPSPDRAFLS